MQALKIAATGMAAQQMRVNVTANNIANMSTTGYNARRAEFSDLHYQQIRTPGAITALSGEVLPAGVQLGLGVRPAAVSMEVRQGPWHAPALQPAAVRIGCTSSSKLTDSRPLAGADEKSTSSAAVATAQNRIREREHIASAGVLEDELRVGCNHSGPQNGNSMRNGWPAATTTPCFNGPRRCAATPRQPPGRCKQLRSDQEMRDRN